MTSPTLEAPIDPAGFEREWEDWHRAHEERRADPVGFLAVTGLHWLGDEAIRVPQVPGSWHTGTGGPVVELDAGEKLTIGGARVTGRHEFGPIPERGGVSVEYDGGVVEVARRGGRDILRPRRPDFPFLAGYAGTPAYVPDAKWRVPARFVRFAAPRAIEVGSAVDGLSHVYEAPGYLEFEFDGETFRLVAFPGHTPDALLLLFTDATSGVTTYTANRSVLVAAPVDGDLTTIDFNRASNLPCAYTDFATCPLPPAENRLPIAVEAGERIPLGRVHGVASASGLVPATA